MQNINLVKLLQLVNRSLYTRSAAVYNGCCDGQSAHRRFLLQKWRTLMRVWWIPSHFFLAWPCAVAFAVSFYVTICGSAVADPVKTVFVIAMENHNWTQPVS